MDWNVISKSIPLYWDAMLLTLKIGWIGVALATLIGLVSAVIIHFRIPVLSVIFKIYIEIFRNTPLLIQLFFLYFALPKIGVKISAEVCGWLGLGLLGGSYMSEAFRSGIEAIDSVQRESALSLGMTDFQVMIHVILPQALSYSTPAFVANIIFLLKETSVFSAISVMDLMFRAKDLIGLYYNTAEYLALLVVFYLIILLPVSVLGTVLERRLRYASFGT
ncbi:amino acid ABC transporter permease [Ruminococcus sp.]|uniref:amino acid ABC transporter permease n=1 Tax=Ruminococcus sp. TaxID=41978 RepID=UPI002E78983E|nr:amino acid ABC transporter permease [Ruminococcus sp.]MEE1264506.1 amino acid ABC transporter permease [Ruminococcus sp.]